MKQEECSRQDWQSEGEIHPFLKSVTAASRPGLEHIPKRADEMIDENSEDSLIASNTVTSS